MSDAPRHVRRIAPDVTALKALTHPVRLEMLGLLRVDGPATATGLAARLGLNSGATSYHLRQLERHGFIEEAAGRGNRRDRWWQAAHESTEFLVGPAEGEALEAGLAFSQAALSHQVSQMQLAQEERQALPPHWREAATNSDYNIPLTPEAAKALTRRLHAVLDEAMAGAPPLGAALPPGTVPFTIILHAFPMPGRAPRSEE